MVVFPADEQAVWSGVGSRLSSRLSLEWSGYVSVVGDVWLETYAGGSPEIALGLEAGLRYTIDWGDWVPWVSVTGGAAERFQGAARTASAVWTLIGGLDYELPSQRHVGLRIGQSTRAGTSGMLVQLSLTIVGWK